MEARPTGTCRTASRGSAWLGTQGALDAWHERNGEEPRCSGGQFVGSGVEERPEVGRQDDLPQFGRHNDSVRDDHGDVGHVKANSRSNVKAAAGDALLHWEADALMEGQARQTPAEVGSACWMQATHLMRRRARACRTITYSWSTE